jgi:hypothetical protein
MYCTVVSLRCPSLAYVLYCTVVSLRCPPCSGERLSYVYEVTESVWKPDLRRLLTTSLTALARLTLAQFCDDDTLCLVGQCCPRLQFLRSGRNKNFFCCRLCHSDGEHVLKEFEKKEKKREGREN